MTRRIRRRRALQLASGSVAGAGLAGVGSDAAAATLLKFDLRGRIPAAVSFRRASTALAPDDSGRLISFGANQPRFSGPSARPRGLLIEAAAANQVESASDLKHTSWTRSGGVTTIWIPGQLAPDGNLGVYRIVRGAPRPDSQMQSTVFGATGEEFGTASVWLRSPTVEGIWRLRLRDFASFDTASKDVVVSPDWRRFDLTQLWQYRATGTKKFMVLVGSTDDILPAIEIWGAQYEKANAPSTPISTTGQPATRAADEVTFAGSSLQVRTGRLTIEIPDGGRRDGVLLDANGAAPRGLRIEYSPSGWIVARVGGLELVGLGEVTLDKVVELQWSPAGAKLSTGTVVGRLTARASTRTAPKALDCGATARVGMTADGLRGLGRVVAAITLDTSVSSITPVATPMFVPSGYALVFNDEFDDTDLSRINENAIGGRRGAPAWRSRYSQDRATVINQEKQIYVDPAFVGTGTTPLGLQPFSIANSVLRIRADRADPVAVSPYIWNYRYVSGCITTQFTHRQKYGYFEMRARMPLGKGFWPAFWLLSATTVWPPEIDVLECSGTQPMSVHQGRIEKVKTPTTTSGGWVDGAIAIADAFHWYGMEWTDKSIAFFLDGRKTQELENNSIHEEMYLLANLAVGSKDQRWIPDPDDSTPFPGVFEIDYVRAYSRG